MYLRWLYWYAAIVQLIFGALFLVAPQQVGSSYGSSFNETSVALARFLGAALLPLVWISWASARAPGSGLKLVITRTYAVVGALDVIVTWIAWQAGLMATSGAILNFVVSAIFLLGFGYYGWVRTQDATM